MDEYQHPLFFEARELTDKEKGKIRRHFQKRRNSGGGDCGMLEKAGDRTYKICFKEKEDQERVLQRKFHIVAVPSGELSLTVSGAKLSQKSDQPSTSPSQGPDQKMTPGAMKLDEPIQAVKEKRAEEDQASVLKRESHTTSLPLGELVLPSRQTSLPKKNQPSTGLSQGPEQDVKFGATKVDGLMQTVKEKRVKLPTALLNFMTSSGATSKYQARFQSLRHPVSLEVGSDLVLTSVSSDALDEAEATMLRDLILDTVRLQGATAVPPDLHRVKEIMINAKNEANLQELKVDVSFIPGPIGTTVIKVRLVGYSETVNKLKEVLNDYHLGQEKMQELLNLPHPEMVDCFDQILDLIGMKQTKVSFKASHFPHPSVLVSGPRCLVQEVQTNLKASLSTLTKDTLVLDHPGAQRYFQTEGKVSKELVESSCQVIIREQQGMRPRKVAGSSASRVKPRPPTRKPHTTPSIIDVNKTSLKIKLGSLEDEQASVLVVPMLNRQLNSTDIGESLLKRAGIAIKSKFYLSTANRSLEPGDVLQVDAPLSLGCNKLFFIECSPWDGVGGQSVQALGKGLKRCLDLCVQQNLCSMAFPVIGPGDVLKYPRGEAIQVLTENIRQFALAPSSGSIFTIHIVIKPDSPDSKKSYHDVYRHLSSSNNQGGQVPQLPRPQPSLSLSEDPSIPQTTSASQKSCVFLFLGRSRKDVDSAKTKLKDLYQAQCSRRTFKKHELASLSPHHKDDVHQQTETQAQCIQKNQSDQTCLTVNGFKDGVNQVNQEIKNPKTANYNLENNDTAGGVVDAQGSQWTVDVKKLEATSGVTGRTSKLKRLANLSGEDLMDREKTIRTHFRKRRNSSAGDSGMIERAGENHAGVNAKKGQASILQRKFHTISNPSGELSRVRTNLQKKSDQPSTRQSQGQDQEVKSGATKPDDPIQREKRVKMPTALLAFITSSGAISKYQSHFRSLGDPVYIEVGSDLVLTSVSSDALDDAEAVLQRDLTLDTVRLRGAAAVPPDLNRVKEILTKVQNEANVQELRVNVSFIPGPPRTTFAKVRLVGYSETVNKLKEVLHDYQMKEVETQELLNLPHPAMFDCFDKIIDLIGMKQTKVSFKTLRFPQPSVLMTGPRSLVQEAQAKLNASLSSLVKDILVLDGPGAQRYFQAEGKVSKELVESSCRVIVRNHQGLLSSSVEGSSTSRVKPRPANKKLHPTPSTIVVNKANLEIKLGSLEDEQVNVLVVPMINRQLKSTRIGKCLFKKAGNAIESKFYAMAANRALAPGDVLQVEAPPSLGCNKLFFIECSRWDGVGGQSMQALGNGLKRCLDLCVEQKLCSVAFPIIGPGIVLKYPLRGAIQVLTEKIHQFGLSASSGSLATIHIVIKPDYPDSEECYHDVYRHLILNMNQEGQAIFRSLTGDADDITVTIGGGAKLQLVFGDITDETTDVVVNTTNFVDFHEDGVCKDILTVAGPEVEAELRAAKVKRGGVYVSRSGSFPCKAILHVSGKGEPSLITHLVCWIIRYCEKFGFRSVAIPAICAGAGGLGPDIVAAAIVHGIKGTTSSTPLYHLTNIRLVMNKLNVFLAFKEEAMQMFSTAVSNRAPQLPHEQQQASLPLKADPKILRTASTSRQSIFLFLGLSRQEVDDAKTKLRGLYQAQCSTQTFTEEQLANLTPRDMEDLKQLVETQGLRILSGQGRLTVGGLKDGVNQVMQKINASLHGCLTREARAREEGQVYSHVSWCILGHHGYWERLPKTANYNLENKEIVGGIVDAQGTWWSVDLKRSEATRGATGQTTKLKRLVNLQDFTLPLYWDNMAPGENFKAVVLQPSSAEYRAVKEAFKRSVHKTVKKIERLQNVHLRRAYEVQKKNLSDKNGHEGGAGEKLLYHGTTQDNCDSIMKTGFNRRFAGQNGTSCGLGAYFAVKASYSANPCFSRPAADGSQLMFVVRVLTGVSTLGQKDMKVPPPRSSRQPHIRYDSVVDVVADPNMYVVFHDSQAYPDYLITFKGPREREFTDKTVCSYYSSRLW